MLQLPDEITPVASTIYPTLPDPDKVQLPHAEPDMARPKSGEAFIVELPLGRTLKSTHAPKAGAGVVEFAS